MTPPVRVFLFCAVAGLVVLEGAWQSIARFDLDLLTMAKIFAVAGGLFLLGIYYAKFRKEARLCTLLFGVAFFLAFAALSTVLTYFASTIAGPRIDGLLASMDRQLGVDYPALIGWVISHPLLTPVLGLAYSASAIQLVVPLVLLGICGDPKDLSQLCVATVICVLSTIAFWTAFPSFGAYTVYDLHEVGMKFHVVIDASYPRFLNNLFHAGPGRIDPRNAGGLIGFPSFHTQEILLSVWYLRKNRFFLVPVAIFSVVALSATPIQGGHHIVDLIGGAAFAAIGIWGAGLFVERADCRRTIKSEPAGEISISAISNAGCL